MDGSYLRCSTEGLLAVCRAACRCRVLPGVVYNVESTIRLMEQQVHIPGHRQRHGDTQHHGHTMGGC